MLKCINRAEQQEKRNAQKLITAYTKSHEEAQDCCDHRRRKHGVREVSLPPRFPVEVREYCLTPTVNVYKTCFTAFGSLSCTINSIHSVRCTHIKLSLGLSYSLAEHSRVLIIFIRRNRGSKKTSNKYNWSLNKYTELQITNYHNYRLPGSCCLLSSTRLQRTTCDQKFGSKLHFVLFRIKTVQFCPHITHFDIKFPNFGE